MKKIIVSSLIAAGFMFTGCANKSLVDKNQIKCIELFLFKLKK